LSRRRIKVAGYSGSGEDPGKLGKRFAINRSCLIIKFQRATGGFPAKRIGRPFLQT
jgi:hypothetical protein